MTKIFTLLHGWAKHYPHAFDWSNHSRDCSNVCWPVTVLFWCWWVWFDTNLSTRITSCLFSWTEDQNLGANAMVSPAWANFTMQLNWWVFWPINTSLQTCTSNWTHSLLPTRKNLHIIRKRYDGERVWCNHLIFCWRLMRGWWVYMGTWSRKATHTEIECYWTPGDIAWLPPVGRHSQADHSKRNGWKIQNTTVMGQCLVGRGSGWIKR